MILNIKAKNIDMDYFKFGNGKKNMVILPGVSIKSVMESEKLVIEAYKIFSNDFTVYVFDRINNMKESYSIDDMANDAITAIEALNLKDIYLFGASQGGMMASLIAIKRPDLIKKLNINSISSNVTNSKYKLFDKLINLTKENKLDEMVDLFCKKAYTKELYDSVKDSLEPFVKSINELDKERFIIQSEALKDFNITDELKNIKCATLIVAGKLDQIFDYTDSIIINKQINNSKIYLYDDYGHDLYDEAKDFKKIVYDFFIGE